MRIGTYHTHAAAVGVPLSLWGASAAEQPCQVIENVTVLLSLDWGWQMASGGDCSGIMLKELADNRNAASLAARLRRRRFALFVKLLSQLPGSIRILDVGGTPGFWRVMGFERRTVSITLINQEATTADSGLISVAGDARNMREFQDQEFDVVFSNSVIEHVGTWADQKAMASEVRRVGRRYFVQTPNRYFPIEPHFLVPGFQFLPLSVRAGWLARRNIGWYPKAPSYEAAFFEVSRIRLLTRAEFQQLFPEAQLHTERFLGLAKSFVVHHGWESD